MDGFRSLLRRARGARYVGVAAASAVAASLVIGLWPAGADDPFDWQPVGPGQTVEFEAGVANVSDWGGVDYYPVAYRKVGDMTQLRGVVGPDVPGEVSEPVANIFSGEPGGAGPFVVELFELPCDYRPDHVVLLSSGVGDIMGKNLEAGLVAVLPNGMVYGGTYVTPQRGPDGAQLQLSWTLDGLTFSADHSEVCPGSTTTEAPTTTEEPTTTTEEVTTTTEEPTTTTEAP